MDNKGIKGQLPVISICLALWCCSGCCRRGPLLLHNLPMADTISSICPNS